MGRIILIICVAVLVAGCGGSAKQKVRYEYIDKPVLVCPTPQELNNGEVVPHRPNLAIFGLHAESTPGEVAKAYQITIKELQGYSEVLYTLLQSYDRTSEEYKKLKAIVDTLYPNGTDIPAQFGE